MPTKKGKTPRPTITVDAEKFNDFINNFTELMIEKLALESLLQSEGIVVAEIVEQESDVHLPRRNQR